MMLNFISLIDDAFLQPEESDHRYDDSPFFHLKHMMPKQKGKRFEQIVESVYRKIGYDISARTSSDHDNIIDNLKCEIKGATLVKGKDIFSFLQIRSDQDYDELVFAMFYPHELVIMKMDKPLVKKLINNKTFKKQHGGNKAESGTYCYYGNKETLEALGAVRVYEKSA
jgi:hypothetical protein